MKNVWERFGNKKRTAQLVVATFLSFLAVVALVWSVATNPIIWTWTGTSENIVISQFYDPEYFREVGPTLTFDSGYNGYTNTTWIRNDGTAPVTLAIEYDNSGTTWAWITDNYVGTTIDVDASVAIQWTLHIDTGHVEEQFTIVITIQANK